LILNNGVLPECVAAKQRFVTAPGSVSEQAEASLRKRRKAELRIRRLDAKLLYLLKGVMRVADEPNDGNRSRATRVFLFVTEVDSK